MPHPPARIISIDRDNPDPATIEQAAAILRRGGLVAFATETVYGLGADATSPEAVARIFAAKGRPATNPLIVHAADTAMAVGCVADWPPEAETLAGHFWPGPLTLVLPRSPRIPDIVTAGRFTVGVRVPEPRVARRLIAAAGCPVAAPSANRSNHISPTRAEHVAADLGDRVDLILDSGPTRIGLESTVLDLTTREPRILRPGPIAAGQVEHVLGVRVRDAAGETAAGDTPAASPGQQPVHYAPSVPTVRVEEPADLDRVAWPGASRIALVVIGPHDERAPGPKPGRRGLRLRTGETPARELRVFHLRTVERASRELYALLRRCEAPPVDLIVIVPPPDRPEWRAVRDRIRRAARPWDRGEAQSNSLG
jgi:L-threonylcarbamoyladenylate synthase